MDNMSQFIKTDQYHRFVSLLQKKCEVIQRENERIVHRMYVVKRLTKCRNKDIAMIKTRLDLYNDSWRTAQPEPFVSVEKTSDRNASNENGVKGKMSKNLGGKRMRKTGNTTGPKDGTKVRRRKTKEEKIKDPNAPKRPANPFFQFCQEQRSVIMDEMNSELSPGEPEPSKQELTRQLAHRWRMMDNNDKQIYVSMYESSKMKYNQDMLSYKKDSDQRK